MALVPVDTGYQFTQSVAADTWTITHNLNQSNPIVDCWEGSEKVVPQDVTVTDSNIVVITFGIGNDVAGTAFVV